MPEIAVIVPEEQPLVLSSLSPGTAQKRLALLAVLGILLVFILLTAGVISSSGTIQIPAFLPAYLTAMFVCDSITSILLFAQFSILRSRALLIIASAYLYTALILIPYVLAFPGVLSPTGVIGGLQSAAWLYVLWHCGFPVFVISYALLKDRAPSQRYWTGTTGAAITQSVGLTMALVLI